MHGFEASGESSGAGRVRLVVRAGVLRVLLRLQGLALVNQLLTLRPALDSLLVDGLVDDLDAVRVVVCRLRVEGNLDLGVEAAVDDAHRFHVEGDGVAEVLGCDEGILLVEVAGEGWAVVAAVGLGPDGKLIGLGLIVREPFRSNQSRTLRQR